MMAAIFLQIPQKEEALSAFKLFVQISIVNPKKLLQVFAGFFYILLC